MSLPPDGADDHVSTGVPPSPSVTPGSAPPPPSGADAPPTWGRRGCLFAAAAAGLVGLLVLGVAVVGLVLAKGWLGNKVDDLAEERQEVVDETGIETGSTDVVHPPQRDISIGTCEFDTDGGVQASGTLTNWSGDMSDYRISVSFREASGSSQGAEFGSTVVTVDGVEEHTTTNWSASVPVRPEGSYTCRIVRIDRWQSDEDPPEGSGS